MHNVSPTILYDVKESVLAILGASNNPLQPRIVEMNAWLEHFFIKEVLKDIYRNLHDTISISIKYCGCFLRIYLTNLSSCNMSMLVLQYFS